MFKEKEEEKTKNLDEKYLDLFRKSNKKKERK